MKNETTNKELVAAGHELAKALGSASPLLDMAKLVSDLSTRLDCAIARGDALAAKVAKLEWDGVFIPKDLDIALTVMGVSLPVSKEEFNLSIERWIQRLVDRVIRIGPELDAERNNLRAEGVEMFLSSLNGATELWHPDAALEGFANQLRAGKDGGE